MKKWPKLLAVTICAVGILFNIASTAGAVELRWMPCDGIHRHMSNYESQDYYKSWETCPTGEHEPYTCYKSCSIRICKWCGAEEEVIYAEHVYNSSRKESAINEKDI